MFLSGYMTCYRDVSNRQAMRMELRPIAHLHCPVADQYLEGELDLDIWDINKLIVFIGFVIPGFISIKAYELLIPSITKGSAEQVIDAVAYSCINYALLSPVILCVEANEVADSSPVWYGAFYLMVLFVCPVLWVIIWRWLRGLEYIQKSLPHPTGKPWDFVFSKRECHWVILTLKNGEKVAGKYAENSFTSSTPNPEQVYLEESWVINDDGGFERPRNNSRGILVLSDEISTVELFEMVISGASNDV